MVSFPFKGKQTSLQCGERFDGTQPKTNKQQLGTSQPTVTFLKYADFQNKPAQTTVWSPSNNIPYIKFQEIRS